MRPGLELTELIDKYLRNELSPADKAVFEQRMETDAALRQEVQLQREVMQGIQRAALKQKAQDAWKQYRTGQNLWKWGLSSLAIILVAAAVLFYAKSSNNNSLPEVNENGEKVWADADKHLPGQKFMIDAGKDTVIVTNAGIVFAVPANVFLGADGKPATGEIEVEVKEALDAASMTQAGLSTRSGDKLLETGGMFYLNARQDGSSLKIDKSKGVYAEVPTHEVKDEMMLFEGKRMPDGSIDWQAPKPLEKFLTPADILSLDFYPPHFLDTLASMGYDITDKELTDSIYYSYAFTNAAAAVPAGTSIDHTSKDEPTKRFSSVADTLKNGSTNGVLTEVRSETYSLGDDGSMAFDSAYTSYRTTGLDPAKVKAVWDKEFNNTLLATREFQERMPYIHQLCDGAYLDIYVNNLDKKLCTIDSMIAGIEGVSTDKFMEFAKRGDGRVQKPAGHFQKLKEYYEKKTKATALAVYKTKEKFRLEQQEMDNEALKKYNEHDADDDRREANNIDEEFRQNLDEAYRQLGLPKKPAVSFGEQVYKVTVQNTGWSNIDRYVRESLESRTTLDYKDTATGKTAVIKYEPLTVQVADHEQFDRVYVYLLPDKLNSFMRVSGTNGKFEEKLNELMHYKLFCIGYKGHDAYMYSPTYAYPQSYNIMLVKTDETTIARMLGRASEGINVGQQRDIIKEVEFLRFETKEIKRQQKVAAQQALEDRIRRVVFPCGQDAVVDCSLGNENIQSGRQLFQQNCAVCHSLRSNVITGPGLAGVNERVPSKEWLLEFTRNCDAMKKSGDPYSVKIDKEYSGNMSIFTYLSDTEIKSIYDYLECQDRTRPAPAPAGTKK